MLNIIPNLLFAIILATAAYFAIKNFGKIKRNILLGKPQKRNDNPTARLRMMLLVAFGQQKMFDRPISALLHLCVYVGFVVVNIEMLEIVTDGLFGTHRVLMGILGPCYATLINIFEFLAVAVILACVAFLIRRNVLKVGRFQSAEIKNWPWLDANLILTIEIALMVAFLTMNASDKALQLQNISHFADTGTFWVSGMFVPLISNFDTNILLILERASWWVHIIGVLLFLNYLPFSKHLHIMLAFPNTYYANLQTKGAMNNMSEITNEVKIMLNMPADNTPPADIKRFGAKDATDLTWYNILNAYTCTECGRCTSVCPANLTGKALSPRKIMMDTRDRMEEIGKNIDLNGTFKDDGKTLIDSYISHEELLACTTCNACVEACPVNISPLEIILELRRYKIMEESQAPQSWNMMFQNMETSFAPWKFAPSDRAKWTEGM
ncbi:MAG: (Fe-S)-binding protein [Cytophagales bacterium]|nr:(Fe-S)-binding protein [Cytophagales bacterium]